MYKKIWITILLAVFSTHAWAEEAKGKEQKKAAPTARRKGQVTEHGRNFIKGVHPVGLTIPSISPLKIEGRDVPVSFQFVYLDQYGTFQFYSPSNYSTLDPQGHCSLSAAELLEQSIRKEATINFVKNNRLNGLFVRFRDFKVGAGDRSHQFKTVLTQEQEQGNVRIDGDGVLYLLVDYDPSRPARAKKNYEHCYAPELLDVLAGLKEISEEVAAAKVTSAKLPSIASVVDANIKAINDQDALRVAAEAAAAAAKAAAAAASAGQPRN